MLAGGTEKQVFATLFVRADGAPGFAGRTRRRSDRRRTFVGHGQSLHSQRVVPWRDCGSAGSRVNSAAAGSGKQPHFTALGVLPTAHALDASASASGTVYDPSHLLHQALSRTAARFTPITPYRRAVRSFDVPEKQSNRPVIATSPNPADVNTPMSSASSRAPAIQPVQRSMSRKALSGRI